MLGARRKVSAEIFGYLVQFRFFITRKVGFSDLQSGKARKLDLRITAIVFHLSTIHAGFYEEFQWHHRLVPLSSPTKSGFFVVFRQFFHFFRLNANSGRVSVHFFSFACLTTYGWKFWSYDVINSTNDPCGPIFISICSLSKRAKYIHSIFKAQITTSIGGNNGLVRPWVHLAALYCRRWASHFYTYCWSNLWPSLMRAYHYCWTLKGSHDRERELPGTEKHPLCRLQCQRELFLKAYRFLIVFFCHSDKKEPVIV